MTVPEWFDKFDSPTCASSFWNFSLENIFCVAKALNKTYILVLRYDIMCMHKKTLKILCRCQIHYRKLIQLYKIHQQFRYE